MQRKTQCDKRDWAAQEAISSPQTTNFPRFKSLLYTEFSEETGHLYTTRLLKLVTFLNELFLLTLLREQLLLTQCCWWLIICILSLAEANVTWLERKSLLIHPCMEGKPRSFSFCSSRARPSGTACTTLQVILAAACFGLLHKILCSGKELEDSHMSISFHEKYHNPCKTKT